MAFQIGKSRVTNLSCQLPQCGVRMGGNRYKDGPLAQLAEQLTLNQPVGGSSPPRLTLKLSTSMSTDNQILSDLPSSFSQ